MRRGILTGMFGVRTAARPYGTGRRFVEQMESRLLLSGSLEFYPLAGEDAPLGTAVAGAAISGKSSKSKGHRATPGDLSGNGYAAPGVGRSGGHRRRLFQHPRPLLGLLCRHGVAGLRRLQLDQRRQHHAEFVKVRRWRHHGRRHADLRVLYQRSGGGRRVQRELQHHGQLRLDGHAAVQLRHPRRRHHADPRRRQHDRAVVFGQRCAHRRHAECGRGRQRRDAAPQVRAVQRRLDARPPRPPARRD